MWVVIILNFFQVKDRTSNYNTYNAGSHVMEYGNKSIKPEKLSLYQGFDPATENLPSNGIDFNHQMDVVNQRDADLLFLWAKVNSYLVHHARQLWYGIFNKEDCIAMDNIKEN